MNDMGNEEIFEIHCFVHVLRFSRLALLVNYALVLQ